MSKRASILYGTTCPAGRVQRTTEPATEKSEIHGKGGLQSPLHCFEAMGVLCGWEGETDGSLGDTGGDPGEKGTAAGSEKETVCEL